MSRISDNFFQQDAVSLAKALLGKILVRSYPDGVVEKFIITETEAYMGTEDLACHASKGRTPRTETLYAEGGVLYVYLIYGMHQMLNIVSGNINHPEALLIRSLNKTKGPGRVGKILEIDRSFNGEDLRQSKRIWIEDAPLVTDYESSPRIGIDYAGEYWKNIPWRFTISSD